MGDMDHAMYGQEIVTLGSIDFRLVTMSQSEPLLVASSVPSQFPTGQADEPEDVTHPKLNAIQETTVALIPPTCGNALDLDAVTANAQLGSTTSRFPVCQFGGKCITISRN